MRVASFECGAYPYLRLNHTGNFYYAGIARDPFVAATLKKAYTGKVKVFVQTNPGSCPSPVLGSSAELSRPDDGLSILSQLHNNYTEVEVDGRYVPLGDGYVWITLLLIPMA